MLYFSRSVKYKWLFGEPDLNFLALTHTLHISCWFYSLVQALSCRQLDTVSQTFAARFPFCVAGKGSGMEKALPRPLRPHGKGGEQSVRSPPATVGHICGRLSPCCSLRRSAARPASALCCSLPAPSPTCSNPKIGHENNQKRCTFSSLIMPPLFFLSQTIYTDGG